MKRKMVFLSVLSAVIMVASIFVSFILSDRLSGQYHPIILPESSSQPNIGSIEPLAPSDTASNMKQLTVNAENAFLLLDSMHRPQDFTAVFEIVWYWTGGESAKTYILYARDQMFKLEEEGGLARYLSAGGYFYHWDAVNTGHIYSVLNEESFPIDKWAGIPTYELIPSVDEIIKAVYMENESLLLLETQGTIYRCLYQISLETMFLNKAEFWIEEKLAYSFNTISFIPGKPALELFILP